MHVQTTGAPYAAGYISKLMNGHPGAVISVMFMLRKVSSPETPHLFVN